MRNGTRQKRVISKAVVAVCENLELRRLMSTVYVDAAAAGANSGADWSDAYTNLQQALTTASSGETILVAQGTYVPVLPGAVPNPNDTFNLVQGVTLQGGYPTGGAAAPDPGAYPAILSGDLGPSNDPESVQSYNVVTSEFEDSSTVLDGFTITGGNADGGSTFEQVGGGMLDYESSPTVTNCVFSDNLAVSDGGGMYNYDGSAPMLSNCTFSGNSAPFGGGMYNYESSSPALANCTFSANAAIEEGGGILNNDVSSPNLFACLFAENSAGNQNSPGFGGGMLNQNNSSPALSHCNFTDNQSTDGGGGMFNYLDSAPQFSYCTFSGNTALFDGGAVYGTFTTGLASATFTNCTFEDNTAQVGGGFYNNDSHPTLIDCLIDGDGAADGSAIYNYQSSIVTMTNCTVDGSVECASFSTVQVYNSILTGYLSSDGGQVRYSDIDGDYYANGIDGGDAGASQYHNLIGVDPMFVGTGSTPYELQAGSPCIGDGDAADVPAGVTNDLAGNPRLTNGNVDMGAYEYTLLPDVEPMDVMVGASTGGSIGGPIGTGHFSVVAPAGGSLGPATDVPLGGSITMSWLDENVGNVSAPGGYVDDVYLSTSPHLNASSIMVDSVTQPQTIAPGASVPVSTTFTLPSESFPTGTYYFVVQDNATDTFPELAQTSGVAASASVQVTPAPQTIYVDANTSAVLNLQDGSSWATAFASLQQALAVASSGDIIDVAQGTYIPSDAADPTVSFALDNGVAMYGGFAGNVNGDENNGDPGAIGFTTYLSGEIGTVYTGNSGHSYSVVSADNITSPTVFSGFTITGGFADSSEVNQSGGGGMFIDDSTSALSLSNLTFNGDLASIGGALYVEDSSLVMTDSTFSQNVALFEGGGVCLNNSSLNVESCTFTGNEAYNYGGAIYSDSTSPMALADCTFSQNTADDGGALNCSSQVSLVVCRFIGNQSDQSFGAGGAIFTSVTTLSMIDCVLDGNTAYEAGGMLLYGGSADLVNCVLCGDGATNADGAIYNLGDSLSITNCTITADSAAQFGAVYTAALYGSTTITNSIVYGDGPDALAADSYASYSVSYSDVQFGASGAGNIDADPQFQRDPNLADNDDGDLQLQPDSPANGAGNYSDILATGLTTDLVGDPRYGDGQVDLGAYEFLSDGPLPDMAALNVTASTSSTVFYGQVGLSWTDANLGNASTGGYTDDVYLSTTPQLTTSSILIDSVIGSQSIVAGDSAPISINVNIPSQAAGLTPGTYYLIVDTNANGRVPEYNQNNNVEASQAIQITSVPHTYYVDADTPASTANQDGRTWATAFSNLQSALALAYTGDTIDVAQGTYLPTTTVDQNTSFQLVSGVTITGGFGGYALGDPTTPNPSAYPTILSGNIGPSLQSYFVVTGFNLNASTVFQGFTITGGQAGMELGQNSLITISNCIFTANSGNYDGGGISLNNSSPTLTNCTFSDNFSTDYGGGIFAFYYSSPKLTNCTFTDNSTSFYGGGICAYSDSSPTLLDCTFSGNTAGNFGGGLASLYTSAPTLTDCTFVGNSAADSGGAVYNYSSSSLTLINCVISGNTAPGDGGAIFNNTSGTLDLINCTLAGNTAGQNGAIFADVTSVTTISNSIIYGDGANELSSYATATFSDIQLSGGAVESGAGNIDADPLFVRNPGTNGASDYGNLELQSASPAINAGSNALVPAGVTTDLAGNPRIVNGVVDMGAYELQIAADTWTGGGGADVSWSDSSNWSNGVPTSTSNVVVPTGFKPQLGSRTFAVASLTLLGNATIDLQSATLMIDYGSNADPISTIAALLSGGYKGGAWNGSGIVSSTVASENISQSARIYSVGYTDGADGITGLPSGQIKILPTLAGDAKMQGNVVFGDFQLLSQYFGKPGSWDEGNFTYGSAVNFGDFQLLSQNFGANSGALAASSQNAPIAPIASISSADSTGIILAGAGDDTILGSWGGAILGNG